MLMIQAEHREGFLALRLEGPLSIPTNAERLDETIATAKALTATGILLDLRQTRPKPDTLDAFAIGEHLAMLTAGLRLRIAVLVGDDNATDGRFIETVCTNRGGHARVFLDRSDARLWLDEPMAERPLLSESGAS